RPVLISYGTRLLVVAVAAAGILLCLGLARESSRSHPPRPLRLGHPVFVVGALLLVANSVSPYLGLKTESSFTMFSNLYTEQGSWNHLFIPEAIRMFPYQDQLVRITDSDDRALEASSLEATQLVRFELERYIRTHPGTSATYVTAAGASERTLSARSDTGARWVTPVLDRILKFQAVPPSNRGCSR
ncbi:MAG TPA: hypothetical protein VK988_07500, partial [Acidimicrobiales bacterium]|nr:hypothetical protein [Acidimicrobiales bacterium]